MPDSTCSISTNKSKVDTKPNSFQGDLQHLPKELDPLTALTHWVVWRWEKTATGNWTKVPYQPDGYKAKNNDKETWSSYLVAVAAYKRGGFDGIGFCLCGTNISAFDVDHCRDAETGVIDRWASDLVERTGSYSEITVSGTGLRIIGFGDGPKLHRKLHVHDDVSIETYRKAERYIVITGKPLFEPKALINIDEHLDATVTELEAHARENEPGSAGDGGHHERQQYIDEEPRLAIDINTLDVSDRIKGLIRGEDPKYLQKGFRSDAVFAVVLAMLGAKCSDQQIQGVMFCRELPIGEHVRDQPNPADYLVRQIRRALAKMGGPGAVVREVRIKARMEDLLKSAAELRTKTFDPLLWVVPKYLPEGLTLLGGRPKIGKSWQALDIAVAVAEGGMCLGQKCEQGDVLALMLEDNDRRLQRRLTQMLGAFAKEWPSSLTYATSWPRLDEGGVAWIRRWIDKSPKARLIVVDILERVRQLITGKDKRSAYSADYEALITFHELATEAMVSILVLHHQRKLGADDLIDTLSGTLGLGGAVDSVLILGKEPNKKRGKESDQDAKFFWGRGRDLEEFSVSVKQNEKGRWDVTGHRMGAQPSVERADIIAVMAKSGGAMTIQEIANACGNDYENVKNLLVKLHREGHVERVQKRGMYKLPEEEIPY
jgi:hypothetical protein